MYRIAVTKIESFRRYLDEVSKRDTEQSVINSIKGLFTGNAYTYTGTAFHKLIENPDDPSIQWITDNGEKYAVVNNIAFPYHQAMVGVGFHRAHKHMVYETDVKKVYETCYGPILVSGRIDGIEGKRLDDNKTKYRYPDDPTEYMNSCQWQFYLDILGTDLFHYNIFEIRHFQGFDLSALKTGIVKLDGIHIVAHEPIACYRYMQMEQYCINLLEMFMHFVERKELYPYLKQVDPVTHKTIRV